MRSAVLLTFVLPAVVAAADGGASMKWDFEQTLSSDTHGDLEVLSDQLQAPQYPEFTSGNRVLNLQAPAWIRIADDGPDSRFDFDNGDAITVEAWVRLKSMGENVYLIGKGRTSSSGDRSLNQNWALRLRKSGGKTCLNFLFRSRKSETHPGAWHRWTSVRGLSSGSRWHHVAICYRFGEPKSIRGFIDGKTVSGRWDMGGPTTEPPVVDDDDVWIGSSMGGNRGNSLDGAIDNIAVRRELVPDDQLMSRFVWAPPAIQPPAIPPDKVVVQLFGPLESHTELPQFIESPRTEWTQDALAFVRLPHKYDAWGARDDWGSTMLVRAWSDLELPAGQYRLLARSRGLSRLTVDGIQLLETPRQQNYSNAHHPVSPLPSVPVRGMRPAAMSDNEVIVPFESSGGRHRIRYDIVIGGPSFRLEFGESCLAIADATGMFHVLAPTVRYPLTDAGWQAFVDQQSDGLRELDRATRTAASRKRDSRWDVRHAFAKTHLLTQQQPESLDEVIERRWQRLTAAADEDRGTAESASSVFYQEQVQPLFETHCNRCHQQKEQGGFRIGDRERMLRGGDSGEPAVVPGQPQDSQLLSLVSAPIDEHRMPPKGAGLNSDEVDILRQWIADGANVPAVPATAPAPLKPLDDFAFLRRVFLDAVGVPPTLAEINRFLADDSGQRRPQVVDRLLTDSRWADNWVGYWQDVLAENPNLLKPTLNNTGPFRYWLHEALTDNKTIDRFATELIMMRGSTWGGGPAGFAVASQNDVPMAAKAHVISSAFLGINLKCARCHDAPYHQWTQSDLFQLAAMLDRKSLKLPASSTVPAAFFDQQARKALIDVSLQPGQTIPAEFPFDELQVPLSVESSDTREQLAAQVTSSRRFAEVIVNRIWKRLMGVGLVEPVDDWDSNPPSDPDLLAVLADTLIRENYDLRAFARRIFTSRIYQSQVVDPAEHEQDEHVGPCRRRMSAEQIVDSAFHSLGRRMDTEQLTLDVEGTLPASRFLNFGYPRRAWELTTLANERDRPSLALPRAQAVVDVLKAFGWRNSRPEPISEREEAPNLIQPGVLANGTLGLQLTRLTDDSALTRMMLTEQSVEELIESLFLAVLTRPPSDAERDDFLALLSSGYDSRIVPQDMLEDVPTPERVPYVSWSNHLSAEANVIKLKLQERVRRGPPPTRYLQSDWRERAEDAVWSLLNSPEMVLIP